MAGSERSSEKSSDKERQHANTRARRHSNAVVVHQSKKKRSKKDKHHDKDTDTESISSSNASTEIVVPPPPKKCPLRFVMSGLFELGDEDGKKGKGCPLRRVQLWHTIPLVLLAVINLLLVVVALLGLAGYRIAIGVQNAVVKIAMPESPYAENVGDADDGILLAGPG